MFNFDILDELMMPLDKEIWYGIAFIHGRTSEFWKVSDIQAIKLASVETSTQKRQRKGGSSSARISRLRENKRDRNVSFVSEELEQVFYDWESNVPIVTGLVIAGSSQTTNMILNELNEGLKRILIKDTHIPWQDCNAIELYKNINTDIKNFHIVQEHKLLEPLHEIMATNSDLLDFGLENIKSQLHLYKTIFVNDGIAIEGTMDIVRIYHVNDLDPYDGIIAVRHL